MVLNRLSKGCKEIDIAATLEHIRDQRGGMVQNRQQFEFCLMAVAEEVHAILKALPQWPIFYANNKRERERASEFENQRKVIRHISWQVNIIYVIAIFFWGGGVRGRKWKIGRKISDFQNTAK